MMRVMISWSAAATANAALAWTDVCVYAYHEAILVDRDTEIERESGHDGDRTGPFQAQGSSREAT